MKNTTSCILKAFVIVAGLASLILGIKYTFLDTSAWPAVQAEVVSSSFRITDDQGNDTFNVSYAYQVDDTQYSGTYSSYEALYPGDRITVYYDPRSPGTSITSKGELFFLGIIGLLFGLFCLGSLGVGALKSIFKNSKKTASL